MIEIQGLTRTFGNLKALDNIAFQVQHGEVVGFLGPNGAGKTTTMRILAGLLAPTEGTIRVAGFDVIEEPEKARAKIGFLPETPPIYEEMTVREYLLFLAGLRGVSRDRLPAAVDAAMNRCGLANVADRLLRNLSKGYRQRAGIAQAIVHNPRVVILDEPTAGLDPNQVREIRSLIRELASEHSILLSTHILPEVQMICSRVILIHGGRIVLEDSLAGLAQRTAHTKGEILLQWRNPPDAATLSALPGVEACRQEGDGWVIVPRTDADPVPELLRRSVENGWDLRKLMPVSHSLEEIFVQLTTTEGDTAPVKEGA
ncbi:MAG: ABC transporter ATP-binding protein [Magnetococcales bacterium]|nr:ABC transporter ATP-binding protein [Magnetococcales bacterium]